jgi:hypothetical protein
VSPNSQGGYVAVWFANLNGWIALVFYLIIVSQVLRWI